MCARPKSPAPSAATDAVRQIAAEEALAESLRPLRSLLDSPAMGMVYWGPDGDILDANETFLRILGHTRDDLEQGRVLWRQIAPPAALDRDAVMAGGARGLIQRQYSRPDGTTATLLVAAAPSPDRRGGIAFVTDVTQQIHLEAQLLHWQKMEAIGRLAGGISHDCNNYLTVILGYSENLLRQPEISAEEVRASAVEIQRAGERAADLMQQLLTFGRQQSPSHVAVRMNDVVSEIAELLRSMIGETVELRLALDEQLDSVRAEAGQLEQMIVNLIVNARDAMPDGGAITLRTANVRIAPGEVADWPECEPGDYVLLSVEDVGAGIPADVQARIFEPFFTTKERGRGAGLGLAIVAGIASRCRGHVALSSTVGRGSTFTVYLPRTSEGAPPPTRCSAPSPLATGQGTVLVVEDDPDVRRLIETTLTGCGYDVHVAADGREALRLCEALTPPPLLVLTDVVLPRMGGRQLGDHVRAKLPATKLLYMTGHDDSAAEGSLAPTADDVVLRKPFSPSTLARAVRRLLVDSVHDRMEQSRPAAG
ncbi:MAG TPA: ATP-binding protein [Pirellulales bacterium]|nr:ATP-binding protein [Pirellulales bacterium]